MKLSLEIQKKLFLHGKMAYITFDKMYTFFAKMNIPCIDTGIIARYFIPKLRH